VSVFGKQSNGWQGHLPHGEGQGNREMESVALLFGCVRFMIDLSVCSFFWVGSLHI
jgi:hypothetical protein